MSISVSRPEMLSFSDFNPSFKILINSWAFPYSSELISEVVPEFYPVRSSIVSASLKKEISNLAVESASIFPRKN